MSSGESTVTVDSTVALFPAASRAVHVTTVQTGPEWRAHRFSPFGLPAIPSKPGMEGWAEPAQLLGQHTAVVEVERTECHGVRRVRRRKVAMQRIP
jgi:hypothetical protein